MPKDSLIVGLDIGSTKIAVCIGTVNEGVLHIIGLSSISHNGLRKGMVDDVEETVSAISHALEESERMAGVNISHAFVGINGGAIEANPAKGVIAISKANGEIDGNDVLRVIEAAKTVALPQNRELIHVYPQQFIVDGQDEIRDPVGMTGIRLEVDSLIISGSSASIRNLMKTVDQAGLEVDGLVFGPLAAAKSVTTKKQRESGVVVVDIGAGSVDLAVFEESKLLHCASLPIGSKHITHDIAIGLRKNLDVADAIKLKYGSVLPDKIREGELINLSSLDPAEDERISRKHVAEIVEARVSEMLHMIKDELQKIGKDGVLPAGVIFTGGGSEIDGLTELAKKVLRLPSEIGLPMAQLSGMIDKIDNPLYATSVGLVIWGMEDGSPAGLAPWRLNLGKFGGVIDKFRGIFRNFTD